METTSITLRHIWIKWNVFMFQEIIHSPHQVNLVVLLEKEEYLSAQCLSLSAPPITMQHPK